MSDEQQQPSDPFWLVIVGNVDGESPQCVKCDSEEAFAAAVKTHVLEATEELFAFGFKGKRIQLATPRPVSSFQIDGKTVKIGEDNPQFDESGHIVPLAPRRTDA
jgi:hypothetical protein